MSSTNASTDVERWRRAEQIFAATLDCAPHERAGLVQRACGEDEDLRRAVHVLLSFDEESEFLDTPLVRPEAAFDVLSPFEPGASVGPYRLLLRIGEGGTSRVYLAERTGADFTQTVAVKLIRDGAAGPLTLRRFQRERRLLARLQHPNIARLLDGGITDDGVPYVVMEHIAGVAITRYCDEQRLSVRARLEIFRGVCEAVQHSHTNLVVHRDIKPSNILVTDEGVPKLLDFGIAAAVAPSAELLAEPTRTRDRALTPEYASPEQLAGRPLTTATDVYSLGVVLHELLVGRRPSPADPEPPAPSAALSGDDAAAVAAARGVAPRQLRRQVAGDLDNIVRRALRLDPAGRYPSVDQLSRDLERHLSGRPIEARAPSWAYRARKFVRRNTLACGLGVLAALCAGAAGGILVYQGERVRRERDAARREQQRAEDVTRFLVDAFAQADPQHSRGASVSAREVLDRGALRVQALDGAPASQSALMDAIGRVYTSLGLYDAANPLLEKALALRTRVHGESSREAAETLLHLGVLHLQKGNVREAEAAFRKSLDLQRAALGPRHVKVAEALFYLGGTLRDRGDYAAAEPLLREALGLRREQLGDDHIDVAVTRTELGTLLQRKGALAEAETVFREAVASFRRLGRPYAVDAATAYSNFAFLLDLKGDRDESERFYREALTTQREVYGERHPAVAQTLSTMSWFMRNKGDYDTALRYAREAVDIDTSMLPPDHPDTAAARNALGIILSDMGDPHAALPLLRGALASGRRALGSDNPDVAIGLHNLASVLFDCGLAAEAESTIREALTLYRRWLGAGHWRVGSALALLADMRRAHGHPRDAVALGREGVDILSKALPAGHWRTAVAQGILGDALLAVGRRAEAGPLILDSAPVVQASQGSGGYLTRRALARVARYEAAKR